ncbi:carbonic anhydrase 2 [Cephus cinctus]|uniref:Carbonic anhydrase 2 n=1 Tax=Cephus cinctus TaxID=211228 RepID=A0AAJ7CBA3_CEPCN|nr:carbonic anhydrase 2 [Cephus cinctus]
MSTSKARALQNGRRDKLRRVVGRKIARPTPGIECCKISCRAGLRSSKANKRAAESNKKEIKELVLHDESPKGQSPVDLAPTDMARNEQFPPLKMTGHWTPLGRAYLYNTGNTAEVRLSLDRPPGIISGGPLKDEYEFLQLHFHWGNSNCHGAEHSINGKLFSMEAHAVHFNKKYASFDECLEKPDGIVVVGYFMQVVGDDTRTEDHPKFAKITDHLPDVEEPNSKAELDHDALVWMKQGRCLCSGYYTYHGSLTTPPYKECVTWILFPDPIRITRRQANAFRSLKSHSGDCITANFRPVQCLNGRTVFFGS